MRTAVLLALLVSAPACSGSDLKGLEGRWNGTIRCVAYTATIAMGLQVFGDALSGDAQTRNSTVTSDWKVEGAQETLTRKAECPDDSCQVDSDCAGKGGGTCNSLGLCRPCLVDESWRRVTLTIVDQDVQSPDPKLELERFGDERLTGTASGFCPDENLSTPQVTLEKDL
ncbi:MAG: hypothetical protein KC503_19915 [Myxococcales bacterium]|nr:hypothetical protein [Myxococcales bacterium]